MKRRKTSTARVFLRPGSGAISVNHRTFETFFPTEALRTQIRAELSTLRRDTGRGTTTLLTEQRLRDVSDAFQSSVMLYDSNVRMLLLEGIPRSFVAQLAVTPVPAVQLQTDLGTFNNVERLADGTVPMEVWLRNATRLLATSQQGAMLQYVLAEVTQRATGAPPIERPESNLPELLEQLGNPAHIGIGLLEQTLVRTEQHRSKITLSQPPQNRTKFVKGSNDAEIGIYPRKGQGSQENLFPRDQVSITALKRYPSPRTVSSFAECLPSFSLNRRICVSTVRVSIGF